MDYTIHVSPGFLHVETVGEFSMVVTEMREKFNMRTILTNIMDRLVVYGAPPMTDGVVEKGSSIMDEFLNDVKNEKNDNSDNYISGSEGYKILFQIDDFSKLEARV